MKTLRFVKTECGVNVLLNVQYGYEHKDIYLNKEVFSADTFAILLFSKGRGSLTLNQKKINIADNTIIFISPFQEQQWSLEPEYLDFTFLVFQEDFLNDFFADKLFTYKLLYFYQYDYPSLLTTTAECLSRFSHILTEIRLELTHTNFDSEHIIRSLLYYLLLKLNRLYAKEYQIPFQKPTNNYAYQFKKILETKICAKQRVEDYAQLLGISRIILNKSVKKQFNVTASHLLRQRLLSEIKNSLIHSELTVAQIAEKLNFSEPNHLMRFFKQQTGMTTSQFILSYQNGIISEKDGSL